MATYSVTLPIVGKVTIELEADNEADALEAAMMSADLDNIDEWDVLRHRCQGNVCRLPCSPNVEKIDDED